MSSTDELKKLFKEAAEIAAEVPEPLREAAFQRALDALMPKPSQQTLGVPHLQRRAPAALGAPITAQRSSAVTTLLESLNRTELAALVSGRKVLDRALLVLRAAQNHGIEALSATDISQVLTQKFREPTTPNAVRMALDRNSEYTDRRPEGSGFIYSLMAPGERYLDGVATQPPATRNAANRQKRPSKNAASKASGSAAPSKAKSRIGKSGRPGPKAMLELLLNEGFFDTTRSMSEILAFIEEKKTHRYSTSDFTATLQRLIREAKMERNRNSQGQYEYKAP